MIADFFFKLTLPVKLAWHSLMLNKGRTFLTVVGIIIGIASVIIVMSAGESVKKLVMDEVDSFGTDYIQTEIKVPSTGRNSADNATSLAQGVEVTTMTMDDAKAVSKLSNIKNYYAGATGQAVASFQEENKIVNFFAITDQYINIDSGETEYGRFFTAQENDDLAKVVIFGSKVADDLFGSRGGAVGQNIKLGQQRFKVIGVMKERGASFGFSFDEFVFVPVQTALKLILGVDHISFFTSQVKDTAKMDETASEITALMRERHEIDDPDDDDFAVTTIEEARDMINSILGGVSLLLVAIAGISLLVGGVGIMNIMYVSVSERTFEIGLRKSVGAKPRQILWQFLLEAIAVTVLGGLIGIIGGILFTWLITIVAGQLGYSWSFVLPLSSVALAFGFCAGVGLLFGLWPAKRASGLDPIAALRKNS